MQIMPIKDLKDTNKIVAKAESVSEPIFVTKNGYGALVVMSMETYNLNYAKQVVRQKLAESEQDLIDGVQPLDGKTVMAELRSKYVKA